MLPELLEYADRMEIVQVVAGIQEEINRPPSGACLGMVHLDRVLHEMVL